MRRIGRWQKDIVPQLQHALESGESIDNPIANLQGKARLYATRYCKSLHSLCEMLDIDIAPARPKGGWSKIEVHSNKN